MANTPNIRFKGFTDDWEQRKLSEVLDIVTKKNGSTYGKENVLSVSDEYGCINQIKFQGRSFAGEDISNYKIVDRGDIIYTRSPLKSKPFGIIKIVGNETGIVSPLYIVNKPKEGNDSQFIYRVFDSPEKTNNYLSPLVRKGAKNTMNISNDEWLSGEITIAPTYDEQYQIGLYFEQLDNLITLHQRKVDETKELKKYMLQKMFPKNGTKKPEIRFAGFTDDWEQRKVGDIATITAGGTPSTKEISYWEPKEIPWLASGEVHKKYVYDTDEMISEEGLKNSSAKWVEKGSVLIALAGQGKTRGTAAITRVPITTNQSIAAIKFDSILDADYAFHNLDGRYEELRNISSGDGTRGGLNKQLLSDLEIMFPTIDEQIKIGQYFSNLDNLITLHQRKCDELKQIKDFMLQNMFPWKG